MTPSPDTVEVPIREGDAVAMTPEGIDRDGMGYGIVKDKPRTGFVVGFSKCGRFVRVKRSGESETGSYFRSRGSGSGVEIDSSAWLLRPRRCIGRYAHVVSEPRKQFTHDFSAIPTGDFTGGAEARQHLRINESLEGNSAGPARGFFSHKTFVPVVRGRVN